MTVDTERLFENGPIAAKRWRHGLLMYLVNDTFISRSIDLYGEWCESELELLGRFVRPGDVAIDVGANIGTHTVFLARAVGDSGVVHAIEPQPLLHQLLRGNVDLNGLDNVMCIHAAAGAAPGRVTVPVLDPATRQNFGALRLGNQGRGEPVDVVHLDDLSLGRCNLIKIDVEGAEVDVLAGARNLIAAHRPALFVENNTIDRSPTVIAAIRDLGYQAWWHIAPYFNPRNYFANKENVFARFIPEANLLCLPHDSAAKVEGLPPVEGDEDDWRQALQRLLST